MKVREIMRNDPACCAPNTNLQEVAAMMAEHNCGQIPVCGNGNHILVGVITDRDIICRAVAQGRNPGELTARDCMTSPCVSVTPDTDVDQCCDVMEQYLIRRLPVVDGNRQLCGIVALADIARAVDGLSTARVIKTISQPYDHAARLAA